MAQDYQQLWKDVAGVVDEAKAVQTLAEILADKEGRVFISRLEREDAELCIDILDHVSRSRSTFIPFAVSEGIVRVSRNTSSKPPKTEFSPSP